MLETGKRMLSGLRAYVPPCRSLPLSGAKGACLFFFLTAGPYVPAALATTETAKLVAADGAASDQFGYSVSISGDTMVIGAPSDDGGRGSAYVFVRSAGTWTQQAKLTASDGAANDDFGLSVAVSGDTVVVGALYDDIGPNLNQGSAYVFVKPGGGWSNMAQTAKLTSSDGANSDTFGYSIAVSDDTVVVGAVNVDISPNINQGSAYVFVKPGGGWINMTQTAKLTASDGATNDVFGDSVGIAGDTVVVSASQDDFSPNDNKGSAYVFVKPGGGWINMTQTAKFTASDAAGSDFFGSSVAVSGDTVVVGAYHDDFGVPDTNEGSAYVFVKPGGGWINMTQTAKLTASDGAAGDGLGDSVSISGDAVVVGAANDDIDVSNQGSAYVFVKPGGGWANMTQTAKLTASDGGVTDVFGESVAISGDTAVGGAHLDDIGANSNQGSAYVYDINPVDPPLAAPAPHDRSKNRYVSFIPNNPGALGVAFKIDKTTAPVGTGWVGAPDANGMALVENAPVSRVWSEVLVHVGDCKIIPVAGYEIRATNNGGATFSLALTVSTTAQPSPKFWADTVGAFGSMVAGEWDPPNGVVNVNDYVAALQKFLGLAQAPHVTVVDVQAVSSTDPCLNRVANIADVFLIIKAFQGNVYPFETNPANCPSCP